MNKYSLTQWTPGMKVQRSSLILLLLAAALGSGVYLYETRRESASIPTHSSKPLFDFVEQEVQAFTLVLPQRTLEFEKRTAKATAQGKSSSGSIRWQMHRPESQPAQATVVTYLLNLLTTEKPDRYLTIPAHRQAEFGFDRPLATVNLTLKNQQRHRLVLGKPTATRSALYALVDPPAQNGANSQNGADLSGANLTVALVAIDFQNAVDRPLAEWKQSANPSSPKAEVNTKVSSPKATP